MGRILISILGAGNYNEVVYEYKNEKAAKGKFVVCAIQQLLKPDEVFVVMTKLARSTNGAALEALCKYKPIPINDGKDETEIWRIFRSISDVIPDNAELIIDVTHGFRSQPILLLSIVIYLQIAKGVKVENILYGAFEAKGENDIAPLISLKPFLDLIEWSFATKSFLETGNARFISKLLTGIQREAHLQKQPYLPKSLTGIGAALTSITEAFSTVRTPEIADEILRLRNYMPLVNEEVHHIPHAWPFKNLIEKIETNYAKIACAKENLFTAEGLKAQAGMIQHYLSTLQYQQAITLARELIVTIVCLYHGFDCLTEREKAETILNEELHKSKNENIDKWDKATNSSEIIFNGKNILYNNCMPVFKEQWMKLIQFRNDINHAAMKKSYSPAKTLIKNITKECRKVNNTLHQALSE